MLCHRYDKKLDKAYQLLKILHLPHASCYALYVKFAQSLALRLREKIFSADTRVNLFCLIAVAAAKNPLFRQVYFSPFLIPLGCVSINYRSKMCLQPQKRLKGEILEELLVAYLHLSCKGKLSPWQVIAAWVVAEQRYVSHVRLFL